MNGWVKDYRATLDWGWFTDVPTAHLWEYIRLKANHRDTQWKGKTIYMGSFPTSIERMAIETGLTPKQVRLALSKLENTGEIVTQRTNKYSIIYVVKWAEYQGCDDDEGTLEDTLEGSQEDTQKALKGQQLKNIRNKEYKNNKKETSKERRFVPPSVEEVREYCLSRSNGIIPEEFVDFYTSKNWMVGKNKMVDWKACIRTWERNNRHRHTESVPDTTVPIYDDSNNTQMSNDDLNRILKEMNRA